MPQGFSAFILRQYRDFWLEPLPGLSERSWNAFRDFDISGRMQTEDQTEATIQIGSKVRYLVQKPRNRQGISGS
jgi:hypothetical protein